MPTTILTWGGYGDVAVEWEEQNNGLVLPKIQKMIDAKIVFFITERRLFRSWFAPAQRTQVTDVQQVRKGRRIIIPDASLEQLHQAGIVVAGSVDLGGDLQNTGEIAKTAEAVAANTTVAVQAPSGG